LRKRKGTQKYTVRAKGGDIQHVARVMGEFLVDDRMTVDGMP